MCKWSRTHASAVGTARASVGGSSKTIAHEDIGIGLSDNGEDALHWCAGDTCTYWTLTGWMLTGADTDGIPRVYTRTVT